MTESKKRGKKANPDMRRVNIRVSPRVHDWFTKRSEETGATISVLMALALEQHIQQQEMSSSLPTLLVQMQQLQQMEQLQQLQQLGNQLGLLKNAQ